MSERERTWGGRFEGSLNELTRDYTGGSGPGAVRARHRRLDRACAHARRDGNHLARGCCRAGGGPGEGADEVSRGRCRVAPRARGHPHPRGGAFAGGDWRGCGSPAYGPIAERSGCAAQPDGCSREVRRCGGKRRIANQGARRSGAAACGRPHAGVHAPTTGSAGDARPPSARPWRDAPSGPGPLPRLPWPHECAASWVRSAGWLALSPGS